MDQIDSWFFVGKIIQKMKCLSYFEVNLLEKSRRETIWLKALAWEDTYD